MARFLELHVGSRYPDAELDAGAKLCGQAAAGGEAF